VKSTFVPALLIFLLVLVPSPPVRAEAVTLLPAADTAMLQSAPDNNLGRRLLGAGGNLAGGRFRTLLKFDVTNSIPSGATVTAVSLTLVVVRVPFTAVESFFELHRFLSPWNEGTGLGVREDGVPALPGETTWNSQFHGTTLWSAGGSAPGADYLTTPSASIPMQNEGTYAFESTGELVADVQAWINGTAPNHGWIMISSAEGTPGTARRFVSREDTLEAPQLIVEYTTEQPPVIESAAREGSEMQIRFTVPSTYCYEVEYLDSLVAGTWSSLTNVCAPLTDIPAIAKDSLAGPQRFYRLRISGRTR
jgi:hypothetical protein